MMKTYVICCVLTVGAFIAKAQVNKIGYQLTGQSQVGNFVSENDPGKLALPDDAAIRRITQYLPQAPKGFGEPYQQRAAWKLLFSPAEAARIVKRADSLQTKSFPNWSDEVYLEFFTTGSRVGSGKMFTDRNAWLPILVWAECIENKGRFVATIEMVLKDIAKQTSWVLPPHDPDRQNISNKAYSVDLAAAGIGHMIAQVDFLLNNKLSKKTRLLIQQQLHKRIFDPVLFALTNNYKNGHGWLLGTNNWNAVCLSGVTGAALAVLPDKRERARFVAIAAKYATNYIKGFADDGYCTEGLGYYDYGFSNFILLRESIWQSTKGKIDLFTDQKLRKIAAYSLNIEMANTVYPTIADCKVNVKPYPTISWYNSRVLGLGFKQYDTLVFAKQTGNLVDDVMMAFPNSASLAASANRSQKKSANLRSYFDEAGILVVRSPLQNGPSFSACIKGGNNNEHHNHNDLGSYTLVFGDAKVVEDPGGPAIYTATTFSKDRYTIRCINSYGHPVPVIGEQLQLSGPQAKAIIKSTSFTDTLDRLTMDISSAYGMPDVKLERVFAFTRNNAGELMVSDQFTSDTLRTFESAIITRAAYKLVNDSTIVFTTRGGQIKAIISTNGEPISIIPATITEETPVFDRIAVSFRRPLSKAMLTVRYIAMP